MAGGGRTAAPLAWGGKRCRSAAAPLAVAAQRAVARQASLSVRVETHSDLGAFMAAKPALEGDVAVVHAFVEPPWEAFDRDLPQAPGGVWCYTREAHGGDGLQLAVPTLCLKLKRREAVDAALGIAAGVDDDPPADADAARRVNELALAWAAERAPPGAAPPLALEFAPDRELQDDPNGPLGNKGGLYIESRVTLEETTGGVLRVTSPTITTPLAGVPPPFAGSHYMKVLFAPRLLMALGGPAIEEEGEEEASSQ